MSCTNRGAGLMALLNKTGSRQNRKCWARCSKLRHKLDSFNSYRGAACPGVPLAEANELAPVVRARSHQALVVSALRQTSKDDSLLQQSSLHSYIRQPA